MAVSAVVFVIIVFKSVAASTAICGKLDMRNGLRFTFSVSEIDHFYHDVPSSLPCPAMPSLAQPSRARPRCASRAGVKLRETWILPLPCPAMPCHTMPRLALPGQALLRSPVRCRASPGIPCHALPCPAMPCQASSGLVIENFGHFALAAHRCRDSLLCRCCRHDVTTEAVAHCIRCVRQIGRF